MGSPRPTLKIEITRKDTHMSKELSPKYNPAEVEAGRYQKWLDEDVFKLLAIKRRSLFNRYSTTKT